MINKESIYRKNLNLDGSFGEMVKEMSEATVRNETDMIAFCIKEYYTKVFKKP